MLNEGIPFVVEGKQIYLPFTGVMLTGETDRTLLFDQTNLLSDTKDSTCSFI